MHCHTLQVVLVAALFVGSAFTATASSDDAGQERQTYLAAQDAIRAGNLARFRQLRSQLDGYVLRGYLDYEFLKDRIPGASKETLHRFQADNQDAPVSNHLRARWLHHLIRQQDWITFLQEYADMEEEPDLNCHRLNYLMRISKDQTGLMQETGRLWLTGNKLPPACDPVIAAWRKGGYMTTQLVWERVGLAMERRNLTLAESLGVYLDKDDRTWLSRWLAMHRNPAHELQHIRYPVETLVARQIVRHGVMRLAFNDPAEAMERWEALKEKYEFFGEDENYVLRWAGILAAQKHLPRAVEWLSSVSAGADDETLRHWRVRAALRAGQWQTGLRFISALNDGEQKNGEWRYWKARLLEKSGDEKTAWRLYSDLAMERSYYGFLAADHLGLDYSMQHVSIEATPEETSTMLARPGIRMAQELFALGDTVSARRQWAWTTRRMSNRQLQVAAVLARHWGWHDRAILTVGKSDHLDDLELRFPILYRDMVEDSAGRSKIDPSWVYGVMRQESAFVTDARSSAGALGLMQLMPQTGRQTGRLINLPIHNNSTILKVENNLRLGTSYLKNVLDVNKGHQVLATASYNAGPNRVREWLPQDDGLDADMWVETIPFTETRNYVKNVLGFTVVYAYRLGTEQARLRERMSPVLPLLGNTRSSP